MIAEFVYMKKGGIRFWTTMIHNLLGLVSAMYVKTRDSYHSLEYVYVMVRLGRLVYLLGPLEDRMFMTGDPLPVTSTTKHDTEISLRELHVVSRRP